MSDLMLEVQEREAVGKNANRRLRAEGYIPAVVYGGDLDSLAIQVERTRVRSLLREGGSDNAVFLLKLQGTEQSRHAMIREMEVDPLSRRIIHIDFMRIQMSQKLRVRVAIELDGTPEGVKNEGGVLDFINRDVEVECLPTDIPQSIVLDVNELHIGDHVEAGDLVLGEGVELTDEPNRVIVSVSHSRVAAEIEELEGAEEEDVLIEAPVDEPEVIGKGKDDEAEEDSDA